MLKQFLFAIFLIVTSLLAYSQKINRFKNKERQGKWVVYQDSTKSHLDNCGYYRKGKPKGVWKYYDSDAKLIKKEIYRFSKIKTFQYYPNGKIKKQGQAKIVSDEKIIHYYYYGNWLEFDSLGDLTAKQIYKEGIRISEINYKTKTNRIYNDSLALELKRINTELPKYFDSVFSAEKNFGKESKEYQRAVSLNSLYTSKLLSELDSIISKFGYPGKTLVGKDYALAFSIISRANLIYKEKYYNLIINAADIGELDWADVAFFVDKVKVAKKEKQIYGTQFTLEDRFSQLFYPIFEIEHLNERRIKVGLDEVDFSDYKFISY